MNFINNKTLTSEDIEQASILWDFMNYKDSLIKSDLIVVLCSHDIRVADYAAELFFNDYGEYILFSGGINFFTKNIFEESEALSFGNRAVELGVPKENIIIEDKSTNTGENISFSKNILTKLNIQPKRIIALQKPSMTLRIKLALEKQWPEIEKIVSSPDYNFQRAYNKYISLIGIINEIVGDFQRIVEYPKLGFQKEINIPLSAMSSYIYLRKRGYTLHLL